MNSKLLYLILPMAFSGCFASMPQQVMSQDELNKQFIEAASLGQADKVIDLLGKGAELTATDDNGSTALHRAAGNGHLDCVKVLIIAQADVNAEDLYSSTPLLEAAMYGRLECLKALIAANADLNPSGYSALRFAAKNGHSDCVIELEKCHLKENMANVLPKVSSPRTKESQAKLNEQFRIAAAVGQTAKMMEFLKKGAEINGCDENGDTALHFAAQFGRTDCVKALLKENADMNSRNVKGKTPIYLANRHGNRDCVMQFIKQIVEKSGTKLLS